MIKNYLIGLAVFALLFSGIFFFYKNTEAPLAEETAGGNSSNSAKTFTLAEVARHNHSSDCWTTIKGSVYNITSFIPLHPGGSVIVQICGRDGTKLFGSVPIHQTENAPATLEEYYIGKLAS